MQLQCLRHALEQRAAELNTSLLVGSCTQITALTPFFLSSFPSFSFLFEDLLSFALSCIQRKRPKNGSRETPDRERGIVYLIPASWADGFKGTSHFCHFNEKLGHGM
jgi:hypothetical protein